VSIGRSFCGKKGEKGLGCGMQKGRGRKKKDGFCSCSANHSREILFEGGRGERANTVPEEKKKKEGKGGGGERGYSIRFLRLHYVQEGGGKSKPPIVWKRGERKGRKNTACAAYSSLCPEGKKKKRKRSRRGWKRGKKKKKRKDSSRRCLLTFRLRGRKRGGDRALRRWRAFCLSSWKRRKREKKEKKKRKLPDGLSLFFSSYFGGRGRKGETDADVITEEEGREGGKKGKKEGKMKLSFSCFLLSLATHERKGKKMDGSPTRYERRRKEREEGDAAELSNFSSLYYCCARKEGKGKKGTAKPKHLKKRGDRGKEKEGEFPALPPCDTSLRFLSRKGKNLLDPDPGGRTKRKGKEKERSGHPSILSPSPSLDRRGKEREKGKGRRRSKAYGGESKRKKKKKAIRCFSFLYLIALIKKGREEEGGACLGGP